MSNEVVLTEGQTEAVVSINMMPVSVIEDAVNRVEEIKNRIMKPGSDYDTIPGCGSKPVLLQPGMEKLAAVFNLAMHYTITDQQIEPHREWTFEFKTKEGIESRKTTGYFRFQVQCELICKSTGQVWASALGECTSRERGRETAPSNTVLKIAEKRAFATAIKGATFSSHLFTIDIEDDPDIRKKGKAAAAAKSGGGDSGKPKTMKSKFNNGFCAICKKKHISEGDTIYAFGDKWAAESCWLKLQEEQKQTEAELEEQPPDDREVPPPTDDDAPLERTK